METIEHELLPSGSGFCSQGLKLLAAANVTITSAMVLIRECTDAPAAAEKIRVGEILWYKAAVACSSEFGIYAVPTSHGKTRYWRPRMPNGLDPELGWLLDTQPTLSGWKTWPDAVNALAEYLDATGAIDAA